tara:strand:+ start:212 stop:502 length:291 start_codon:yes stop_codon:yes gene_type:complete
MTILEIMERANTRETKLVVAWIKDAIAQMQSDDAEKLSVNKQNIVKVADGDDNQYSLPAGLISINSVSVLDTEDDNKYKVIRRLAFEPIVSEDTNP